MRPRLTMLDAEGLSRWEPALRRLESTIRYPLDDGKDAFFIDHGEAYPTFFSALGEARFLVAHEGSELLGIVVGVFRRAEIAGIDVEVLYGCDLKIAPAARGKGLSRRMFVGALTRAAREPELRRCRLAFAGAMRGARGDVTRTVRGTFHPGHLAKPLARLAIYFADPAALAALPDDGPPKPTSPGMDFSPPPRPAEIEAQPLRALAMPSGPGLVSTAGRKHLVLASTNEPMPLVHLPLGPKHWPRTWGAYLRECGRALVASSHAAAEGPAAGPPRACFAIDDRLDDHVTWLRRHGMTSGAVCTVYGLVPPFGATARATSRSSWVHLATSEI